MALFLTYFYPACPQTFPKSSHTWRKAGGVSLFLTLICSNHSTRSKLETRCTSKGIWFIKGATPQDFKRPSTCLSKLTFLAISKYFKFALLCDSSAGCQDYSPATLKVCQPLMSLMMDSDLGNVKDTDQFCNCSLKALHNWCIFMVLRLVGDTRGLILLRAGLIDSFPLKLPIF